MLDPTGDLSHQDPILPRHGMQRTANTLGLKVTAESKKKYMKKSCVVDKYRRMAGYVEISCKKGAENRRTVESFWNEI